MSGEGWKRACGEVAVSNDEAKPSGNWKKEGGKSLVLELQHADTQMNHPTHLNWRAGVEAKVLVHCQMS